MPNLYIIAGPNGAGKTTAAYNLLPSVFDTFEFVNADEIAKGISPFNPEGIALQAGRIMLERLEQLISEGKSLAFETTLSGLVYLKFLTLAKKAGYEITLFFVWLNSYKLAIERVANRVSKGGHNIPTDVIERRYAKGINNFTKYSREADNWYIYDNSGPEYVLIAKSLDQNIEIINFDIYNRINQT